MRVLTMTSPGAIQDPTVLFQTLDNVTHLHLIPILAQVPTKLGRAGNSPVYSQIVPLSLN